MVLYYAYISIIDMAFETIYIVFSGYGVYLIHEFKPYYRIAKWIYRIVYEFFGEAYPHLKS